jgi:MFS transporter, ACS family, glucarate transporter
MAASPLVSPALVIVWLHYATDNPRQRCGVSAAELRLIAQVEVGRKQTLTGGGTLKAVLKNGQLWTLFGAYAFRCYVGYMFIWWSYIYLVEFRRFSLVHGAGV